MLFGKWFIKHPKLGYYTGNTPPWTERREDALDFHSQQEAFMKIDQRRCDARGTTAFIPEKREGRYKELCEATVVQE